MLSIFQLVTTIKKKVLKTRTKPTTSSHERNLASDEGSFEHSNGSPSLASVTTKHAPDSSNKTSRALLDEIPPNVQTDGTKLFRSTTEKPLSAPVSPRSEEPLDTTDEAAKLVTATSVPTDVNDGDSQTSYEPMECDIDAGNSPGHGDNAHSDIAEETGDDKKEQDINFSEDSPSSSTEKESSAEKPEGKTTRSSSPETSCAPDLPATEGVDVLTRDDKPSSKTLESRTEIESTQTLNMAEKKQEIMSKSTSNQEISKLNPSVKSESPVTSEPASELALESNVDDIREPKYGADLMITSENIVCEAYDKKPDLDLMITNEDTIDKSSDVKPDLNVCTSENIKSKSSDKKPDLSLMVNSESIVSKSSNKKPDLMITSEIIGSESSDKKPDLMITSENIDSESSDDKKPDFMITSENIGSESSDKKPDLMITSENIDSESSDKKPDLMITSENIDSESSDKKPDLMITSENIGSESTDKKPDLMITSENIGSESSDKKPDLMITSENIGSESSDKKPDLMITSENIGSESTDKKPDLMITSENIDSESSDKKPDLMITSENIDSESSDKKPDTAESMDAKSEVLEITSNPSSPQIKSGTEQLDLKTESSVSVKESSADLPSDEDKLQSPSNTVTESGPSAVKVESSLVSEKEEDISEAGQTANLSAPQDGKTEFCTPCEDPKSSSEMTEPSQVQKESDSESLADPTLAAQSSCDSKEQPTYIHQSSENNKNVPHIISTVSITQGNDESKPKTKLETEEKSVSPRTGKEINPSITPPRETPLDESKEPSKGESLDELSKGSPETKDLDCEKDSDLSDDPSSYESDRRNIDTVLRDLESPSKDDSEEEYPELSEGPDQCTDDQQSLTPVEHSTCPSPDDVGNKPVSPVNVTDKPFVSEKTKEGDYLLNDDLADSDNEEDVSDVNTSSSSAQVIKVSIKSLIEEETVGDSPQLVEKNSETSDRGLKRKLDASETEESLPPRKVFIPNEESDDNKVGSPIEAIPQNKDASKEGYTEDMSSAAPDLLLLSEAADMDTSMRKYTKQLPLVEPQEKREIINLDDQNKNDNLSAIEEPPSLLSNSSQSNETSESNRVMTVESNRVMNVESSRVLTVESQESGVDEQKSVSVEISGQKETVTALATNFEPSGVLDSNLEEMEVEEEIEEDVTPVKEEHWGKIFSHLSSLHLQKIVLHECEEGLLDQLLSHCHSLKTLIVSGLGNPHCLVNFDPSYLLQAPGLENLQLLGRFKFTSNFNFIKLRKLKKLNLDGAEFTRWPYLSTSLTHLYLNPISTFSADTWNNISALTNLKQLSLSNFPQDDSENNWHSCLYQLSRLENLALINFHVTQKVMLFPKKLPNLKKIAVMPRCSDNMSLVSEQLSRVRQLTATSCQRIQLVCNESHVIQKILSHNPVVYGNYLSLSTYYGNHNKNSDNYQLAFPLDEVQKKFPIPSNHGPKFSFRFLESSHRLQYPRDFHF